jgi:transposase
MTNVKNFVGIDVSKDFFDVAIVINVSKKQYHHERFYTTKEGFISFGNLLKAQCGKNQDQTLICMEHTGVYNWPILNALSKTKYILCLEMAVQIKMSLGIQRGKNDKLDSKRIAEYAYIQREKLSQWQPSGEVIEKLQHLMALRERIVKTIQLLEVPINEIKTTGNLEMSQLLEKLNNPLLEELQKSLSEVNKELQLTLKKDEKILELYKRVISVKGIGEVIGIYLIIYTKGFTILADKKKLGSYTGVVPFEHSSGSTIKKKSKTSKMSNATLRCNLAMGAKSAMQWDPELKAYSIKKIEEGKTYGWCVNAVSNKLLARVISCVNNKKDYVVKEVA